MEGRGQIHSRGSRGEAGRAGWGWQQWLPDGPTEEQTRGDSVQGILGTSRVLWGQGAGPGKEAAQRRLWGCPGGQKEAPGRLVLPLKLWGVIEGLAQE